jgi:hypothetical protein
LVDVVDVMALRIFESMKVVACFSFVHRRDFFQTSVGMMKLWHDRKRGRATSTKRHRARAVTQNCLSNDVQRPDCTSNKHGKEFGSGECGTKINISISEKVSCGRSSHHVVPNLAATATTFA